MAKTEFSKKSEQKLRDLLLAWGHEIDYDGPLSPSDLDAASKLLAELFLWATANGYYVPPNKRN